MKKLSSEELLEQYKTGQREFNDFAITGGLIKNFEFYSASFRNVSFYGVKFENTIFHDVFFREGSWCSVGFTGVTFKSVNISVSELSLCLFIEVIYIRTRFNVKEEFCKTNFVDCAFQFSREEKINIDLSDEKTHDLIEPFSGNLLSDCLFQWTDGFSTKSETIPLQKTRLNRCRFENLTRFVDFSDSNVYGAVFQNCYLYKAIGLEFDCNKFGNCEFYDLALNLRQFGAVKASRIQNSRTHVRTKHHLGDVIKLVKSLIQHLYMHENFPKWLYLRHKYTGPSLFLYLLLAVFFVLINVSKVAYLILLGTILSKTQLSLDNIPADIISLPGTEPMPVWQVIIGGQSKSYWLMLTNVIIIMYTCFRTAITIKIASLQHKSELTGISPQKTSYWSLWRLDRIITFFWFFALGMAAWSLVDLLFTEVPVLVK